MIARRTWLGIAGVVLAGGFLVSVLEAGEPALGGGKYMGAEKCKSCHQDKKKGAQFTKWTETKHSKAWEALASDEAKKIAAEKGIADPQKDDKCVKCHVTGFGEAAEKFDAKFDRTKGIQCEQCHGAAGDHVKARMADDSEDDKEIHEKAKKEMPLPEMKDVCTKCHNSESPTIEKSKYWDKEKKEFDFKKAFEENIAHPNPMWQKK